MALGTQYDLAHDGRFVQLVGAQMMVQAHAVCTEDPATADHANRLVLAGFVLLNPHAWAQRFALLIALADGQITKANAETRLPNVMPLAWIDMVQAALREQAAQGVV